MPRILTISCSLLMADREVFIAVEEHERLVEECGDSRVIKASIHPSKLGALSTRREKVNGEDLCVGEKA